MHIFILPGIQLFVSLSKTKKGKYIYKYIVRAEKLFPDFNDIN